MRKAGAIAATNLRRVVRDKTAAFFIFVFPFLIILALGATFGQAFTPKLGVAAVDSGALGEDLVARLRAVDGLEVVAYSDADALRTAVERGRLEGGLVIPAAYDDRVRAGETVPLDYLARPTGSGQELRLTVASVTDQQGVEVRAARFAIAQGAATSFDAALGLAHGASNSVPTVMVTERTAGTEDATPATDQGAAQELVLFIYVTSLSASAMLIETRRLGISRRMLASPTPMRAILFGEALGRYSIAFMQGVLIMAGTVVLFRVDWGNLLTSGLTVALFAATATGAAMLMGATLRNEQQAGALGIFVGLGLAALGGAMVPIEVFPPVMARVAHLTPHAWALDALFDSMATDASPAQVATDLLVLALYATILIVGATVLFRRTLTRTAG